jgi:hypothetical protein
LSLSILLGIIFTVVIINPLACSPRWLIKTARFWSNQETRTLATILFCLLLVVYNLISAGFFFPAQPLTGDEPHYLLIVTSLVGDKDTDLANNFANQDYLSYYPGKLTPHTYPGRKKGSAYSRHGPGLSLLLLPTFALAQKLTSSIQDNNLKRKIIIWFSRWPMTFFCALLVSLFFLLVVKIFDHKILSFFLAIFFGLSPPLIFYSHLIYPEIPAALILLISLWSIISKNQKTIPPRKIFISSLGLAFLPWLGVKYIPLTIIGSVILGVWLLNSLRKQATKIYPALASFFLPLATLSSLLAIYTWKLYGNVSPVSFYRGVSPGEHISQFFHLSFLESFRCGLGYFFDQRTGLLPYNFTFFLILAGVLILIRANLKIFLLLISVLVTFWGFTSLGYYWGGYCPPGRTLLPLIWIMWFFITPVFLQHRPDRLSQKSILFLLIILTIVQTGGILTRPDLLYHQNLSFSFNPEGMVSKTLQALSNHLVNFTKLVPHLSHPSFFNPWVLLFWLIILGGITFVFHPYTNPLSSKLHRKTHPRSSSQQMLVVLSAWIIIGLVFLYSFFDIHLEKIRSEDAKPWAVYAQDNNSFGPEAGGIWVRGRSKADFLLQTPEKISQLTFELSSPVGMTVEIKQGYFSQKIKLLPHHAERIILRGSSLVYFPWKNGILYPLTITTERGFFPFRLNTSTDRRFLGVFLRLFPPKYKQLSTF